MEIEQVIKISQLYDFYSDLLSDKQKQYLNDYYFNDLSLTEISEIKKSTNNVEVLTYVDELIKLEN